MNCNIDLHESLIESGDIVCPFCDQKLEDDEKPQDRLVKYELCCEFQDIINDDGRFVCKSCAIVQGYTSVQEYVDFHSNKHKIKRKSVYHRKCHIQNTLILAQNITFIYLMNNKVRS